MLNFLIADDHPLFRDALKAALRSHFSLCQLHEAADFEQTFALAQEQDIDILLLDLHMPGNGDLYGLIRIREHFPELPIAVVSGTEDLNVVSKVMAYGAMAFIPKASTSQTIAQAVQSVLDGDEWLPEAMRGQISALPKEQTALAQKVAELTPQQYKVLCYLHEGLLNKQIAYELNISEATVKAHITAIFRKLDVYNRTQAVLIAAALQLEPAAN